MPAEDDPTDDLLALLKRRGYLQPSYDLYGGAAGFYDYGPLGSRLKRNLEDLWRSFFVLEEGMLEVETPTVSPEAVFRASGHVDRFADPLVECRDCGRGFRGDHLLEDAGVAGTEDMTLEETSEAIDAAGVRCPACGGTFEEAVPFNLMFRTTVGPGSGRVGYMRPETAQGIFMLFPWLYRYNREQLPVGGVQVGRAYRNEISPRQGMIRLREFSQMEAEVFFDPQDKRWPGWDDVRDRELNLLPRDAEEASLVPVGDAVAKGVVGNEAVGYFLVRTAEVLEAVGLGGDVLRFRQHHLEEMAHYSEDTWDAEVWTPRYGWVEVVGIADRTDYDLRAHAEESGERMSVLRRFDEPRTVEVHRVVPDPASLGPVHRERAKPIMEALEALDPETVDPDAPVTVEVDGEEVTVDPEHFEVERTTETVAGEEFVPHVVEPSFGVDRILWSILQHAYDDGDRDWAVLRLPPGLAPIEVAVLPLMDRDGLGEAALELDRELRSRGYHTFHDTSGNIGRRYARMDEVGTPLCVTVDYDTLEDGTVTVRDRDTMEQGRVARSELADVVDALLAGDVTVADLDGSG